MLNNFQGQPLTPIERSYNRSTPGFAAMLGAVQQYGNRVEENRRIAEQRNFQREQTQSQFENQKFMVEFSNELQTQAQRELNERRGEQQIQLNEVKQQGRMQELGAREEIRRRGAMFDLELAGSEQALSNLQNESYVRAAGTRAAAMPETLEAANATLRETTGQLPSMGLFRRYVTPNQTLGYERLVVDAEGNQVWQESNEAEYTATYQSARQMKDIADGIDNFISTNQYDSESLSNLLEVKARINAGAFGSAEGAIHAVNSIVGSIDERIESREARQARTATQRNTANYVLQTAFPTSQRGSLPPVTRDLLSRANSLTGNTFRLPSVGEMQTDPTLKRLVASGDRDGLESYITQNYVSLTTMAQAAKEGGYLDKTTRGGSEVFRDETRGELATNLLALTTDPGSGTPGDIFYFNPFASPSDEQRIVNPRRLAQLLIDRGFGEGLSTPTETTTTENYVNNAQRFTNFD